MRMDSASDYTTDIQSHSVGKDNIILKWQNRFSKSINDIYMLS